MCISQCLDNYLYCGERNKSPDLWHFNSMLLKRNLTSDKNVKALAGKLKKCRRGGEKRSNDLSNVHLIF